MPDKRIAAIHRLYTEDIRRQRITREVSAVFDNFTLQPTTGFYKGRQEPSMVIEIIGATEAQVKALAARIREINAQSSVLILRMTGRAKRVTRRRAVRHSS